MMMMRGILTTVQYCTAFYWASITHWVVMHLKLSRPPYHSILGCHGLDLPWSTLRPIRMAQCERLVRMGKRVGSVSRCRRCAATATFAGSACVQGRRRGDWRACAYYKLGLYCEAIHSLQPHLLSQRTRGLPGLGALELGSSGLSQI